MKILLVNLLRLGDVIATAPAIKAIRGRHPGAEIHLMVNSNFEVAAKLIANVDGVVLFERDRLQSACVEAERPMFEAYDFLQSFVETVSAHDYDLMFNFTHNRLSGWLCGLIAAKEKVGLILDGSGAVSFGSAWFRHLNHQVDFDDQHAFNHTDIFIGAAGGWEQAVDRIFFDNLLVESQSGRDEASACLSGREGLAVALQLSTSDVKKEWGDSRFRSLAQSILRQNPSVHIYALGAPEERDRLTSFCSSVDEHSDRVTPAILSLSGVVSLLEQTDILITGDTSIKHIASAGTTKVIEIIVGSADAFRTGSWKSGDLIVCSRELCAPCGHSELCHRSTHACAIGIAPEAIAELVSPLLREESVRHLDISEHSRIQIFEVDRSEGPVNLVPVAGDVALRDEDLALSLERSARRMTLETRDRRFDRMQFGSEILNVKTGLRNRFPATGAFEMRHALAEGESRLRHAEGIVHSLKIQLLRLKESYQDPMRIREMVGSVAAMRIRLQKNPWTRFVAEPLMQVIEDDRSAPFAKFRKLSDVVRDLEQRLAIGLKLIRGLEAEFECETTIKSSIGERI